MSPSPGDFSPQAEAYARARPSYPAALVEALCKRARVFPGDPVAELGAGTGLFTAALVPQALALTAIEPNASMRAHAPALAGVDWRDGRFERTGLPDASVTWVVAAQAFHWADPERALPELRRILRPGGALTVLWNQRELKRSALLRSARAHIDARVPGFDEGYRNRDWAAVLTGSGDFSHVVHDELHHEVRMSHARFMDLWRSHNKLAHALRDRSAEAGLGALLADIAAELHAHPDPLLVPYRCRAWTVYRD